MGSSQDASSCVLTVGCPKGHKFTYRLRSIPLLSSIFLWYNTKNIQTTYFETSTTSITNKPSALRHQQEIAFAIIQTI